MKTARLSHNRMTHEPVASDFYTILKNTRYGTHTYADVCIYQAVFVRRGILEPPCPFGSAGHVSDTNAL